MLEIRNLNKSFPNATSTVLDGINLELSMGDFCVILGANGSGKSSLLKSIMGEYRQDKGSISIDGAEISNLPLYKRACLISSVDQDITKGTIGEMSLLENIVLSNMKSKGATAKLYSDSSLEIYKIVKGFKLGLEKYLYSPMNKLSGGQRQAVATIMVMLSGAKLLLLDEHTSALDPKTSIKLMALTAKYIDESDITTLMVTHNIMDAIEYGNRLIILSHGKIIADFNAKEKMNLTKEAIMRIFQSHGDALC